MMFQPVEFIGFKPCFGWQGIIPARAGKFARLQMEQVEKIVDIKDLLAKLNPDDALNIMEPELRALAEELPHFLEQTTYEAAWENTPDFIKKRIIKKTQDEIPALFIEVFNEVRDNFDTLFDAKSMVIEKLTQDKTILNHLIQTTVGKELQFLVKSGLYLGTAFGVFQMLFWYNFPSAWYVLPIGGFLVGYLTNWIAVKMMFKPLDPVKVGSYTLQGLFLKRKNEVAKDYAATLTSSVLDSENIAHYLLKGPASDKLANLVERRFKKHFDNIAGFGKHLLIFTTSTQSYIDLKDSASKKVFSDLQTQRFQLGLVYTENTLALDKVIETKMKDFTPLEFDGFIRPIFEQDEWILYLVGGSLGFLAGLSQFMLMFA